VSKVVTSIGLMSGTSLDGIDVALLRTDGAAIVERGLSRTYVYTNEQRALLRQALVDAKRAKRRTYRGGSLAEAERALTEWHINAVRSFVYEIGIKLRNIDIVGFHGQTVLHRPEKQLTLQIGDGQTLANALDVCVAHDLRAADVAAGGQGAPLVPVYHQALAGALPYRPVAFVNVGGVANVTYVGENNELIAFDTGPGNAMIDDWMLKNTGVAVDFGGQVALAGVIDEATVAQFLGDGYFEMAAPKSLDRNAFSGISLDGLSLDDGAATLTAVTARSIALAAKQFPDDPQCWVICGGGRKNAAIMQMLRDVLPNVYAAEDCGFNGDAMEAEAWAYLAVRSWRGLPITFPGTTGVPQEMTGGIIAEPSSPSSS
jgi:anhydro-N-acetylmuramic acid kinase